MENVQSFSPLKSISGELNLPGDKSISHRAVIFASLAKGKSEIKNLSDGEDVKSTRKCFSSMGIEIKENKNNIIVFGNGYKGLRKPDKRLDAGNSGTTTRLLSGILIAQEFETEIVGDESLSNRPMKRIINPLSEMGGKITATDNYTLPIKISPSEFLHAINYEMPVASAQVKSAIILAGIHINDETKVIEKNSSRDHTERMLGLKVTESKNGKVISASKKDYPMPKDYYIPSDISTAAFFIVLALLSKNSQLKINNVSLNESRTGVIKVLSGMGADIKTENYRIIAGEPIGDIIVKSSNLKNIDIREDLIPNIIDEIPILTVAGIFAEGEFKINHAEELRGKETDRIKALCYNLKLAGIPVEEYKDGFAFEGKHIKNKLTFESFNDHRIAMAFSILSLLREEGGDINNFDCVKISNPGFLSQLNQIIKLS